MKQECWQVRTDRRYARIGSSGDVALAQNVSPIVGSSFSLGINSIGYVMLILRRKLAVLPQRQGRNFEFERRTEAVAWEIAADQQSFLRIHIQGRISR